jgi:hypothetical protein
VYLEANKACVYKWKGIKRKTAAAIMIRMKKRKKASIKKKDALTIKTCFYHGFFYTPTTLVLFKKDINNKHFDGFLIDCMHSAYELLLSLREHLVCRVENKKKKK